mgnify:CR=1 FL=1
MSESDCRKLVNMNLRSGDLFSNSGRGLILDFFPWLRYFGHPVYKEVVDLKEEIEELIQRLINERKVMR